MKTLFDRMMLPFEWIAQPSGIWFQKAAVPQKSKRNRNVMPVLSPECSNIRGGRRADLKKIPAP
jgi:hypothetical protein